MKMDLKIFPKAPLSVLWDVSVIITYPESPRMITF